jgi:hypothetical protein
MAQVDKCIAKGIYLSFSEVIFFFAKPKGNSEAVKNKGKKQCNFQRKRVQSQQRSTEY